MKEMVLAYFRELQNTITDTFETLEPTKRFEKKPWEYEKGEGGGEMRVLRGDFFEKAAVNFSMVGGTKYPFKEELGPFFACGVSLITHMHNPHHPTCHMNVRFIETKEKSWFGGGYDLTPMGFEDEDDKVHFHGTAKKALHPFGNDLYQNFSKHAKEYFFIPHRNKERGVGGLFFDNLASANPAHDFLITKAVGNSFLQAIMPLYERKKNREYSKEEKDKQQRFRAHYVEFNLLYDKGTKFGFLSGGNPEAILCSMPPCAMW